MTFYYDAKSKTLIPNEFFLERSNLSAPVTAAALTGLALLGSPITSPEILAAAGKTISNLLDKLFSPGGSAKRDSEVINEIIKEGRNQGVEEMEFEFDRDVSLGLNLKGFNDVDLTIGSKGKTRYSLKVKYKASN
ncbi:hypothetical protein H6F88_31725 [Oculatella sp. FACHB-28]|uniref:hypothetical protein n=1 Tax=Oculatella sp. FACHB-28 TaxID=2692845 RepID=UPI0016836ABB|nr:hypothetical protein [Oculatella sp. FACHB-28]MBD2060513.1 hypothetical protein [Oculatella sp. FACHB-28]